ncbi:MAG: hypothetical protein ABS36_02590 [Acidobacteria bacterium SCN 69-37]|nr:MAG: hypothetical protein ABS36_02590 [Acidobacteria bacterium SCN 69-37]
MPRCVPVLAALVCAVALSDDATAQVSTPAPPVRVQASAGLVSGVIGVVTDEAGTGIGGASILAMGATLAVVRTDDAGYFRLELTPGPYILRATRDGYVSTYREAVHVRTDAPLVRTITLLRSSDDGDVVLASVTRPIEHVDVDAPADADPIVPSDTAWRLRHLPRTVLRDETPSAWGREERRAARRLDALSPLPDITGRVELITTSALAASGELPAVDWPRGVAYVVLGAPVGTHGDWSVRASLAGGETAAWTLAAEYASRTDQRHAFRAGVSHSAQTFSDPTLRHSLAAIDTVRHVGGVHAADVWTVGRGLEIDSRLRVERYEYLADPMVFSGRLGVRQQVGARFVLVATASPHMVAPGADQFTPPASAGVWLPPERTFSSLRGDVLRPERVNAYDAGVDAVLGRVAGATTDVVLRVRRIREQSINQLATIFGLDDVSQVGHYYMSSPGDVALDGWLIGLAGDLTPYVHAAVDYRTAAAAWTPGVGRLPLRRVAPSAARTEAEQLHDVTATVEATVPSTATRVSLAVRINSAFSRQDRLTPGSGARFALEIRQQLPGRPFGGSELNLLWSARTLMHEFETAGGFYDELLTVAPPVRLTCGLQMRF